MPRQDFMRGSVPGSGACDKQSCIGTVSAVGLRQGLVFLFQFQFGMGGEEVGDQIAVFLGFDRAGGIDEAAAGLQAGQGVFENGCLGFGQTGDVVRLEPPADVDTPTENAGVRAGDVEEDGVELAVPFFRSGFGPIVGLDGLPGDVEALEVLFEAW